jgi:ligand-binding sensor domain-containing protein/two-component sensor histidine kinase
MQKFCFIGICSLLHVFAIKGIAQQTIFKTYTVSDGLVNNAIRKVFQDSKGFLWISTWEGLSKYDGNRFTNFTERNGLSHNLVNDIGEAANGDIYVAMNNGCVDVINHDKVIHKAILQNVIINQFYHEHGKLVAVTDNAGIIEIDGDKTKQLLPGHDLSFYSTAPINDSLMVAATDIFAFVIYSKSYKTSFNTGIRSPNYVSNFVYRDAEHRVWLGTSTGLKLLTTSPSKKEIKMVEPPSPFNVEELRSGDITAIFQQSNGSFWFATNQGLINISARGKIVKLKENAGLPSHSITCLFNDSDHNLWIGTAQGLAKILSNPPVPVPDPSHATSTFSSIVNKISNEECLLLSNHFLYRYNFTNGKIEPTALVKNDDNFIYVKNSYPFLFVDRDKVMRYNDRSNTIELFGQMDKNANALCATTPDQKNLLMGAMDGLWLFDQHKFFADSFFSMRVQTMISSRNGYVWIGTWERGLYRAKFNPQTKSFTDVFHFKQLPDEHIRSMAEDNEGNIWVGTRYKGVLRITEISKDQFNILHFDQQTGLTSNWIRDEAFDEQGNVWLASTSGVDKLIKKNNDYVVFNYSKIINLITSTNFITFVGNKRLLCSTMNGVFQLTDAGLENQQPLAVHLTKIVAGKEEINELLSKDSSVDLKLPYSGNHAAFEFTTTSYLNEKEILYSYRLKGSGDTAWSHPSNSHSVQYASLEPGRYQFEVRMLGWNGSYGPITSFLFMVKPPYWNTWWFYSLIVLFVLLALYSLYRYRINHLLRVQKVRNTIATDLHDDIGSTLTNISILSELSKKNLEQPQAAEKLLQRITEESVASQQALDDIIWSVNTSNDNMQELQARMRRYVAEVFESGNISCQFNFENTTEGGKLNMEQRRDLYLVFKECMNNIHKHASAKNIYIKIAVRSGILNMLIEDDGKGFDPNIITHRNGLKNLKIRVEKWKGNLKIDTTAGKGARIQILMPVKTSLLK